MRWYLLLLVFLCVPAARTYASEAVGIIDASLSHYAWSENFGWINFAATSGAVNVTDSAVTGYVWGGSTGWINLAPTGEGVRNDGSGNLSGFAWGTNVGWIDFDGVTIDSAGKFTGVATSTITGRISFDCTYCDVRTDWRSVSIRSPVSPSEIQTSSVGGGGPIGLYGTKEPFPVAEPPKTIPISPEPSKSSTTLRVQKLSTSSQSSKVPVKAEKVAPRKEISITPTTTLATSSIYATTTSTTSQELISWGTRVWLTLSAVTFIGLLWLFSALF